MTTPIEDLWVALRRAETGAQRRIDATHPLDLYADYEQPSRPGLILFTSGRPHDAPSFKAINIDTGQRSDGRWSLRISLAEPRLFAVFAELCRDIVESTRTGVAASAAAGAVLSRLDRWRTLMQSRSGSLNRAQLRGLIGELVVLETRVLPQFGADEAVASWTGPMRTNQDFRLPTGLRIEVKALEHLATEVQINGLGQLDGGTDPIQLLAVRLQDTGRQAEGAFTAAQIIARLRTNFAGAPAALSRFEQLLGFSGWDDADNTDNTIVRLNAIDQFDIADAFPRLIPASVPEGIIRASYVIRLPRQGTPA